MAYSIVARTVEDAYLSGHFGAKYTKENGYIPGTTQKSPKELGRLWLEKDIGGAEWRQMTTALTDIYKQLPEEFRTSLEEGGTAAAADLMRWNENERKTNASGMGPLDPIIALGWGLNKVSQGLSYVTGIHQGWTNVGVDLAFDAATAGIGSKTVKAAKGVTIGATTAIKEGTEAVLSAGAKELQERTVLGALGEIASGRGPAVDAGTGIRKELVNTSLYKRTIPKEPTYLERILGGMDTTPNPDLDLSPGSPNFIDKVGMDVEAGKAWLKERSELSKQYFKTGTKKGGDLRSLSVEDYEGMISDVQSQINSISEIPLKKQTAAQKTLKKNLIRDKERLTGELKYYDSWMNTGPALKGDPGDVIMYGKKSMSATNPESIMADLKGKVEGWTPQAHKSTDWHHWNLNELTTPLNRRMRELIKLGKAKPNDELNLHAFTWQSGRTYGSRVSGGKGLENTAHQGIHKVGAATEKLSDNILREGPRIEPSTSPFLNQPLNKTKPPNNIIVNDKNVKISIADWKTIQQADLDVNRFDVERIMAVAEVADNLPFAIQQLKEFKFDKNGNISQIYEQLGPDNLSEMQRYVQRINKAESANEILAIAMEIEETLTKPLSEMMEWANDYAQNIGARELMKYTHKPKEFYKDAAEWYMKQLDLKEHKFEESLRKGISWNKQDALKYWATA